MLYFALPIRPELIGTWFALKEVNYKINIQVSEVPNKWFIALTIPRATYHESYSSQM